MADDKKKQPESDSVTSKGRIEFKQPIAIRSTAVKPSFTLADSIFNVNSVVSSSGITISPDVNFRSLEDDNWNLVTLDSGLLSRHQELNAEIEDLRKTLAEHARTIRAAQAGGEEKQQRIQALEETLEQLRAKERLGFLLNRVNADAQRVLLQSSNLRQEFLEKGQCTAFVMSVDIRRSTELMLKARSPEDFARFTTTLCSDLNRIVVDSYGVFDKFTGDGILAFFPDFYSGADAAYRVVAAADQCHAAFKRHYYEFRKSFTSVLKDVGLGIGIDCGPVRLVQVAGGLTVVGAPVVYACRLSGAPPGTTLVNQPAYEAISESFGAFCFAEETDLEIKHEGRMVAYEVRLNGRNRVPSLPDWLTTAQNQTT